MTTIRAFVDGLAFVFNRLLAALEESRRRSAAREIARYRDVIADADAATPVTPQPRSAISQDVDHHLALLAADDGGIAHVILLRK
jgi:hypothetical protein